MFMKESISGVCMVILFQYINFQYLRLFRLDSLQNFTPAT
jgi:hypothetical protein